MTTPRFSFPALLIVFFAVLGPALNAGAESGTLADCLSGCRPDDAECTACCAEAFASEAERACLDNFAACTNKCDSLEGLKALMCHRACQDRARADLGPEAKVAEFSCSGWVRPGPCPDCQTWSPRQQQCVPAPKELCDQKQ